MSWKTRDADFGAIVLLLVVVLFAIAFLGKH